MINGEGLRLTEWRTDKDGDAKYSHVPATCPSIINIQKASTGVQHRHLDVLYPQVHVVVTLRGCRRWRNWRIVECP